MCVRVFSVTSVPLQWVSVGPVVMLCEQSADQSIACSVQSQMCSLCTWHLSPVTWPAVLWRVMTTYVVGGQSDNYGISD